MKTKTLFYGLFIIFMTALTTHAFAQDGFYTVKPERTNVTITLPNNFSPVFGQPSYIHKESATTFHVKEVNVSVSSIYQSVTKEFMANSGENLLSLEDFVTTAGVSGKLYHGEFVMVPEMGGTAIDYERLTLIIGTEEKTIWLIGNMPKDKAAMMKDAVLSIMKTLIF